MKNEMPSTEACYNALQQLQRTYIDLGARGQTGSHWIPQYYSWSFNLWYAYVSAERGSGRHLSLLIQNAWTEGQCVDWERHTGINSFSVGCTFLTGVRKKLESHQCCPQHCFLLLERESNGPRDTAYSPCASGTCYMSASPLILEGKCYISRAVLKLYAERMPKPPCFHYPCTLGAIFSWVCGLLCSGSSSLLTSNLEQKMTYCLTPTTCTL